MLTKLSRVFPSNKLLNKLDLYPKLSKGNYRLKEYQNIKKIELYNNSGQLLKKVAIEDGIIKINEAAGTYLLKATYKDGAIVFGKVVKQ